MPRMPAAVRGIGALCLLSGPLTCSGGGGPSGPSILISPTSLTFSAADPNAPPPASQDVTLTLNGTVTGTLYVRVVVTGDAVASISDVTVLSATQGRATVHPADPAVLGSGTHSSVISVSACTTDVDCTGPLLAGSPQTVHVTYPIGALPVPDGVAPRVGTANVAGEVMIRGMGFTGATSVSFGSTPATTFSVVSSTEIHATYPALAAGTYPVHLQAGAATIPFTESLAIVPAPAYPSTSLTHPAAPQGIRGIVYDAERKALLVGAAFATTSTNQIWRYEFSGNAWQPASAATHADLRDIALSMNGSRLLAVSDGALAELDPTTLLVLESTPKPPSLFGPNEYLKGIAVANDGNAVVTTGYKFGSGSTSLYLYSSSRSSFSTPRVSNSANPKVYSYAAAGTSSNGAAVAIFETAISPSVPAFQYVASSGRLSRTTFQVEYSGFDPSQNVDVPAFDARGSRMVVATRPDFFSGTRLFSVYDANFARLGSLPSATTRAYAVAPDASRVYTLDRDPNTGACRVRAFDLTNLPGSAGPLAEIATGAFPIELADCTSDFAGQSAGMLVTPAGDTLFIAGNLRVAVVSLQ